MADIVLGLLLLSGAWRGFTRGLLREVISLLGFGLALLIANERHGELSPLLVESLAPYFTFLSDPTVARVLAFVLIVLVVLAVANLIGEVLHRMVGLLFLGFFDRAGGLAFGLLESALMIEVALVLISVFNSSLLETLAQESRVAAAILPFAPMLFALLPWDVLPLPGVTPHLP